MAESSKTKLALSARLLRHAHAPVFRSTVFPILGELKQDLIDAAGELERQQREITHLTDMVTSVRPAPETPAVDRIHVRNAISGTLVENNGPRTIDDNLAIALCTYFQDHPECPDEPESDEHGWKPWVIGKCNFALDAITDAVMDVIERTRRSSLETKSATGD